MQAVKKLSPMKKVKRTVGYSDHDSDEDSEVDVTENGLKWMRIDQPL